MHLWDLVPNTRAIEGRLNGLKERFRLDIGRKVDAMAGTPADKRPLAEVEAPLLQELHQLVNELRRLEVGELQMAVCAFDEEDIPRAAASFDLTLFESDIADIFKDLDDYRFGFGVHLARRAENVNWVAMHRRSKDPYKDSAALPELISGLR